MFNPAFYSLLAEAHVEELRQAAPTYRRGRDVRPKPAAPPAPVIKRAINRLFARRGEVHDEVAAIRRFELADNGSAASLWPQP